jgi:hypothetical protein
LVTVENLGAYKRSGEQGVEFFSDQAVADNVRERLASAVQRLQMACGEDLGKFCSANNETIAPIH